MGPIMASDRQEDTEALEIDSWEEIEETDVLEKKISQLIMPSIGDSSESSISQQEPVKVTLTGDDAYRSQYVPPEPTVKILRRPAKDAQNNSNLKNTIPKKTLQQREQEYAEARLRILGEPRTVEASVDEKFSIVKLKSSDADLSESSKQDAKTSQSESENIIIRLPKGPDDTKGFKIRR